MLIRRSRVRIIDNTRIKEAEIHHIYNKKAVASVGDIVRVSIKSRLPKSKISRKEVFKALITTVRSKIIRKNGLVIYSSLNTAILLNKKMEMEGTKVDYPVFKEFNKSKQFGHFQKNMIKIV